ncbi:MAG: cell division protein FtsA [Candidatus Sungbacteria bacterium]|uniref:Cell division protein FtsA n=2 Tax=Candidatus Sungiibacteriota bacterium TaxID=2750080 RepID=A0A932DS65_9BACT|nr:cell division protein FtsA [Candidatus Sungbacteria bacterium]
MVFFTTVARERIITALDLGSHKIRVATLLIGRDDELKVIAYGESWTRGVRRGQLIDAREAVVSIKEAVAAASRTGNVKISKIVAGLGGPHFKLMNSRGSIAVSRADGEISPDDVNRVLDSARAVSIPSNREIVHTIPVVYTVDGEEKIKDPVGMRGVRLEAEVVLVLGLSPVLRSVRKAVAEAGLELEKIIYTPLASSRAVLTKKQRELGSAVVDIGASTTSICIWEESDLKHAAVVPVGSSKITDDVAIGLRVSPEISEKIKTEHGCCLAAGVSRREQVVLADWSNNDAVVPKWELARIIEARASEILEMVQEEFKKTGQPNFLPAGVVLAGGGARLEGLVDLARKKFKLPVELGRVREVKTDFNEIFTADAATLTGLLLYEYDSEQSQGERAPAVPADAMGGLWHKIKDWLADLVP